MSLFWSAWSPLNLFLDAFLLGSAWLLGWIVVRGEPRPLSNVAWARAIIAGVAPWPLLVLLGLGLGGFFLLARFGWTFGTVALPVLLVQLARERRERRLFILAAAILAVKVFGEVIEPDRLEVQNVTIPVVGLKAPVRITHLSDLQMDGLRGFHDRVRAASDAFDPDLIVFSGDVINHASLVGETAPYLRAFHRKTGAYIVTGDVDFGFDWPSFTAMAGFTPIDGKVARVKIGPTTLDLLGLALGDAGNQALFDNLIDSSRGADARILLSHRPDALKLIGAAAVAVLFTGHTHGGQVCLPWFGPIVTLTRVSREIAAGGVHIVGGTSIVLSRGLGWEGHVAPRVRLFCRPHLLLVTLVPAP
ncbi:hypothetical protein EPO15_15895 [bacterium]|nr:MAG: hypothetical protein EPO15_15895 [bacterium]